MQATKFTLSLLTKSNTDPPPPFLPNGQTNTWSGSSQGSTQQTLFMHVPITDVGPLKVEMSVLTFVRQVSCWCYEQALLLGRLDW